MRVVVAGCGRVGTLVAERLNLDGHEVAVIDTDPKALDRLGGGFAGRRLRGNAMDQDVLEAAGIVDADAAVSVTSRDSVNVVVATAAKERYRVPRVVARIYDPLSAEIYRRLGLAAVSSTTWIANEIRSLLVRPGGTTFGDGEVRMVNYEVPPRLEGHSVQELERPGEILVTAVVRSGAAFVPTGPAQLRQGDLVYLAVASSAFEHALKAFQP